MKRDLDLIREILLLVEGAPPGKYIHDVEIEGYDHDTVAAHVQLLVEADYVDGATRQSNGGEYITWGVDRLKMPGHDYLDSIRDPTVYRETKQKLSKVGGTAALEVVKAVAQGITNTMLGLS